MMVSLWQSVERHCRWLWRRLGRVRVLLGLEKGEPDSANGQAEARARFWAAVQEGQREAEAECSRRESQSNRNGTIR